LIFWFVFGGLVYLFLIIFSVVILIASVIFAVSLIEIPQCNFVAEKSRILAEHESQKEIIDNVILKAIEVVVAQDGLIKRSKEILSQSETVLALASRTKDALEKAQEVLIENNRVALSKKVKETE
jgi:hypothetical protein